VTEGKTVSDGCCDRDGVSDGKMVAEGESDIDGEFETVGSIVGKILGRNVLVGDTVGTGVG